MKENNNNKFLTLKQEEGRTQIRFKMVLLGTAVAGKSTFLCRILTERFFENTRITIGADFFTKKLRLDNIDIKTYIWDFSGAETHRSLLEGYVLGAKGAIIMFDLSLKKEYTEIEKWLKFFRDNAVKNAPLIIVGNKLDLIDSTYGLKERKDIQRIAQELNSPYFEISVKTGQNVKEVFNTIMNLMLEQIQEQIIQAKLPFDFTGQLTEESNEVEKLIKQYEEEPGKYVITEGFKNYYITEAFKKWLKDEKVYDHLRPFKDIPIVKDIIKSKDSHYDILLIDDDLSTLRLLTTYFKSKGVTCKALTSGTQGLEELENNHPKVVLLDIILPDIDGFEICKRIKSNQKLKPIPVFFIPSIPRSEVEKRLAETKADGYILKPFNFSDFDIILDLLSSKSVKEIE